MARRTLALMRPGPVEPAAPETEAPPDDPTQPPAAGHGGRRWPRALAFGLAAGALTGFAVIGLVAAPLFLWAKATEPGIGLQRPLVRDGLRLAPALGLLVFAVTALFAARWRLSHEAVDGAPQ